MGYEIMNMTFDWDLAGYIMTTTAVAREAESLDS